jgi:hypothetical protein
MGEMTNAYPDWETLIVPTDKESAVVLTSESDEKESVEVRTKKKPVYELVSRGKCTNYYQEKFDRELRKGQQSSGWERQSSSSEL